MSITTVRNRSDAFECPPPLNGWGSLLVHVGLFWYCGCLVQVLVQLIVIDVCLFFLVCSEAFEQFVQLPTIDYVNEQARGYPPQPFIEGLGVDVAGLAVCHLIAKVYAWFCEPLVQPGNTDTVSAPKVSHCGVPAGLAHSYHGLVVFMKLQTSRTSENIPELSGR